MKKIIRASPKPGSAKILWKICATHKYCTILGWIFRQKIVICSKLTTIWLTRTSYSTKTTLSVKLKKLCTKTINSAASHPKQPQQQTRVKEVLSTKSQAFESPEGLLTWANNENRRRQLNRIYYLLNLAVWEAGTRTRFWYRCQCLLVASQSLRRKSKLLNRTPKKVGLTTTLFVSANPTSVRKHQIALPLGWRGKRPTNYSQTPLLMWCVTVWKSVCLKIWPSFQSTASSKRTSITVTTMWRLGMGWKMSLYATSMRK